MEQLSLNTQFDLPFDGRARRVHTPAPRLTEAEITAANATLVNAETVITGAASAGIVGTAVAGANVTEIILPPGQRDNFERLLPMLTLLNQEDRWLAWIDPPQTLVNQWRLSGVATDKLLILHSEPHINALELTARALAAGTCSAVVAWVHGLGKAEFSQLEQASAKGQSHGVLLRCRTH